MGKYSRKHIGKTFNDGKLLVVDGSDKMGYVKVKCSDCAEDFELFGDGIFEVFSSNLTKGFIPCGCSKFPQLNLKQYETKIKRKIAEEKLPIRFLEFGETTKYLVNTPVILYCERYSASYKVSSISSFLQGNGNFGKTYTADERISLYELENTNYRVWNSGKRNRDNRNVVCGFYCKTCESNGYESLYEVDSNSLFSGQIPCHCSKHSKNVTGDYITQISKIKLHEDEVDNVQVFGAYKKGKRWLVVFICEIHGIYSRHHHNLRRDGCHCLKCTPPKTGYDKTKKGYIYLLDIQSTAGLILGYGITNKFSKRLTTHRKNLKSIGATITNIQVFEGSGTAVLAVENDIKSLHTTGLLDCEGFRRESISIDMKDKVLEKCKKLKQLDNTDKLI